MSPSISFLLSPPLSSPSLFLPTPSFLPPPPLSLSLPPSSFSLSSLGRLWQEKTLVIKPNDQGYGFSLSGQKPVFVDSVVEGGPAYKVFIWIAIY